LLVAGFEAQVEAADHVVDGEQTRLRRHLAAVQNQQNGVRFTYLVVSGVNLAPFTS